MGWRYRPFIKAIPEAVMRLTFWTGPGKYVKEVLTGGTVVLGGVPGR